MDIRDLIIALCIFLCCVSLTSVACYIIVKSFETSEEKVAKKIDEEENENNNKDKIEDDKNKDNKENNK